MSLEMNIESGKIAEALSAAQGEISNAKKDTQGHGYKYADLAQIIEIIKPILSKHQISFVQPVSSNDEGKLCVSTILMHSSGEYIKTTSELPTAVLQGGAGKNPIQVAGSAITYMRRYQLAGMVGIAQEDDDAQGYVKPKQQPRTYNKPKPTKEDSRKLPELSYVDDDKFKHHKLQWAKMAKGAGSGGLEKFSAKLAKDQQVMLSESQINEIQNIIMDLAKSEHQTEELQNA